MVTRVYRTVTAFGNAQVDTSIKKWGTGSLQLDGSGDYIQITFPASSSNTFRQGTDGWTISFWIYPTASSGTILSGGALTGTNDDYKLYLDGGVLKWNNLQGTFTTFDTASVANNTWTHIQLKEDINVDSAISVYIDGVFKGSYGTFTGVPVLGSNPRIGCDVNIANFFTGYIDSFHWTNYEETATSVNGVPTAAYTELSVSGENRTLVRLQFDGEDGSQSFEDSQAFTTAAAVLTSTGSLSVNASTTMSASANLSALATQLTVQNPAPGMVYLQNDVYTWADTDTWDTIYDSDDKWAVYERLNASFAITVIGSDFDIASSQVFGEFALSAKGGLEQNGNARLEDAFTQTAKGGFLIGIDDPYDYTWDTIPEDQWNGFFTDQWRPSGWFAFDAVTLNDNGGLALVGQADLTSTAAVAVDARLSDVRGSADLNSAFTQGNVDGRTFLRASADLNLEFTLASGSDNSKDGSATLEAFAAEVTVGRLSDVRGSAEFVSQFTLTSGSDLYRNGSSTLEAQANLTIAGAMTLNAGVILDTAFALESNSRILKLANLDITSLGDLSVVGSMTFGAGTTLAGNFTQSVSAGYSLSGSANLAAEFTEIVRPTLIPSVQLDEVAFNADLTARGQMTYGAAAQLEAFAAEVAVGQRVQGAKANLEAEFTSIVTGSATLAGQARLDAFVAQLTDGRISSTRGSATLSGTFVAEFAGELKLLDSQFIYMVLNENRLFGIESETRKHDVLSENRLFDIEQESRGYQVLPENRTVDVGYFMQ
jgi:hypothetical protein